MFEDFENAQKVSYNEMSGTVFGDYNFHTFYTEGLNGARFWIEGLDEINITPYSGQQCVGMELTDLAQSRRNEFNLFHLYDIVGNEFTTEAWYYLPSDWTLDAGNGLNWYAIFAIQTGAPNWAPYLELHIEDMTSQGGSGTYKMFVINRDENQVQHRSPEYDNFPLPLGRWFKIKSEFSQPSHTFKVWVDNILVADMNLPLDRTPIFDTNAIVTICKIYHDDGGSITLPKKIWIDDVTINQLNGGENMVLTDANGYYNFPNLAPGDYTITVTHPDHVTQTRSVTIMPNQNEVEDFTLAKKPGSLSGTVDDGALPIQGAEVIIV